MSITSGVSGNMQLALHREVEARLVTQIIVATQDMPGDANLLLRIADKRLG